MEDTRDLVMKVGDANDPLSMMMTKRMVGMIRMITNDTYKSAPSQKCNYGVEADYHQRRS